ncbi:hypothetical protein Tco_0455306 [Tanacetum coccineum]
MNNDIVSSKGPDKYLLKWYEDTSDKDIPEFKFLKDKAKGNVSSSTACCDDTSFQEFPDDDDSSDEDFPDDDDSSERAFSLITIKNYVTGLANGNTWDLIQKKEAYPGGRGEKHTVVDGSDCNFGV